MESREILEKIVEQQGSCDWVNSAGGETICSKCPMSKLKKKEDGSFYSCVESLNLEELPAEEQNKEYKDAAIRLLLDMSMDDLLSEK